MATLNELFDFYDMTLNAFGLDVSENGSLQVAIADALVPVVIDKLPLTRVTQALLDASPWDRVVGFHPLCENTFRKQSPVIKKLRDISILRINSLVIHMLTEFATLAADQTLHDQLPAPLKSILSVLHKADARFCKDVRKLCSNINSNNLYRFVNLYIQPYGKLGGKEYYRTAIVTFPILDALHESTTVFDVAFRREDIKMLRAFIQWVFPDAGEGDVYSRGSKSTTAPTFDALMRAHLTLARHTNRVMTQYKDMFPHVRNPIVDTDDKGALDDLAQFKGLIPVLKFNDGDHIEKDTSTPPVESSRPSSQPSPPAPRRRDPEPTSPPAYTPPPSGGFNVAPLSAAALPAVAAQHRVGNDGSAFFDAKAEREREQSRESYRTAPRGNYRDSRDSRDYDSRDRNPRDARHDPRGSYRDSRDSRGSYRDPRDQGRTYQRDYHPPARDNRRPTIDDLDV